MEELGAGDRVFEGGVWPVCLSRATGMTLDQPCTGYRAVLLVAAIHWAHSVENTPWK